MKKWDKIIHECYVELYKSATPSANFDDLVQYAKDNNVRSSDGRFSIPFDDYTIDESVEESIINSVSKKYRLNKYYRNVLRISVILGCSPRYAI